MTDTDILSHTSQPRVLHAGALSCIHLVGRGVWKERWFALTDDTARVEPRYKLHCYRGADDVSKPLATIILDNAYVRETPGHTHPGFFEVVTPGRVYEFAVAQHVRAELDVWISALRSVSNVHRQSDAMESLQVEISRMEYAYRLKGVAAEVRSILKGTAATTGGETSPSPHASPPLSPSQRRAVK
eukprot:PhM_4_TR17605/c0_g1_i1/m.92253